MRVDLLNRISKNVATALSLVAVGSVSAGYFAPRHPDEGALAHIFQLSIVALAPTLLFFMATADWKRPARAARELTLPGFALIAAFVALYFLEHR